MTASITHCWKSTRFDALGWLLAALLLCGPAWVRADDSSLDIVNFEVQPSGEDIALSATLNLVLSKGVQEALRKGISVIFVAQADVLRKRWYWRDEKVVSVQRHMRLAYQPLTRRWRLSVASGAGMQNGLGVALNQNFDTFEEALASVNRLSRWRIASLSDLEARQSYLVDFHFHLDLAQLPRPLQIGSLGQSDWAIAARTSQAVVLQAAP